MTITPLKVGNYFSRLSIDDLQSIPDIGPAVAESIYDWFNDKNNQQLLEKLEKAGVEIEIQSQKSKVKSQKLIGLNFVLTGELEILTRDGAKEKIRSLGGDVSSSVSKNTDFVVVGKNPGSKYDKARELGVKIIEEEEFLKMIR
jgi:DNA ligase (NAD+)